jgi:predicted nucleic acid-binding protein
LEEAKEAWLEVRSLSARDKSKSDTLRRTAPVGHGEADAIALAENLKVAILMDDRVAVDLARMRGVEARWTTSTVLEAHRRGFLDRKAARATVADLVATGLWIRQDVLLRVLAILREG